MKKKHHIDIEIKKFGLLAFLFLVLASVIIPCLVGAGLGWMVGVIAEYIVGHDLPFTPFALGGILFVFVVGWLKS